MLQRGIDVRQRSAAPDRRGAKDGPKPSLSMGEMLHRSVTEPAVPHERSMPSFVTLPVRD